MLKRRPTVNIRKHQMLNTLSVDALMETAKLASKSATLATLDGTELAAILKTRRQLMPLMKMRSRTRRTKPSEENLTSR